LVVVILTVELPISAAVAVPEIVAVPLPLSVKVKSPLAGSPLAARDGAGYPVVVTVKLSADPTVAEALAALVMAGLSPTWTSRVSLVVPMALVAVIVSAVVPLLVGVPDSRAVPLPLSVKFNPAGGVPVSVIEGVG
jgi:hypothetical protein